MSVVRNRAVWWPVALTALFAITYLAPRRNWVFDMQLYRLSGVCAPAFMVYRELSGVANLVPPIRRAFQSILLVLVALCWFTFILLPFWSDFRIRGLGSRGSRILFAVVGILLTVFCWLQLGGGCTTDE